MRNVRVNKSQSAQYIIYCNNIQQREKTHTHTVWLKMHTNFDGNQARKYDTIENIRNLCWTRNSKQRCATEHCHCHTISTHTIIIKECEESAVLPYETHTTTEIQFCMTRWKFFWKADKSLNVAETTKLCDKEWHCFFSSYSQLLPQQQIIKTWPTHLRSYVVYCTIGINTSPNFEFEHLRCSMNKNV